ncbi:MAG: hypothetical protein PHH82_01230 [Candidatus ainarchaeum sp.]|nr:hypothetical protein [Candidatus ainarchaeum sp.]
MAYFVKSFEKDFVLKTIKDKKKVDFQTVDNVLTTKALLPNTLSFGKTKRLACSYIDKNYLKTYRSQGLIFETKQKPDQVYPFDLVVLTNANKLVVQYYRIENNLHEYYGHELLSGFEKFMFGDPQTMIKKIISPKNALELVNAFRKKHGFKLLSKAQFKLVEYNEMIFNKPINIKPVAICGYTKLSKEIAKKYSLPHFRNVKEFYNKTSK